MGNSHFPKVLFKHLDHFLQAPNVTLKELAEFKERQEASYRRVRRSLIYE